MNRTEADQHQAQQMRTQRAELTVRVRKLRQAAAQGHAQATTRLTIYKLSGAPCPNPDCARSIERHLKATQTVLKQLQECEGDPDLDGLEDMILRARQRCELLQRLAATTEHPKP